MTSIITFNTIKYTSARYWPFKTILYCIQQCREEDLGNVQVISIDASRDLPISLHSAWDMQCVTETINYLSSNLIHFTRRDIKTLVISRVISRLEELIWHYEVCRRCKDDLRMCVTLRHNDPFNSLWDLPLTVVLKLSTAFHIVFGIRVRFIMTRH